MAHLNITHGPRALLTGEAVSFLYPDMATALRGRFVAATMLKTGGEQFTCGGVGYFLSPSGPGLVVVTHRRLLSDGMLEVEVGEVAAPRGAQEFTSDPSTSTHLSSSPLQRDPYEAKLVAVRRSSIPEAGVGVFTTAPVTDGTIIAYFNGVHKHKKDVFSEASRSAYLAEGAHPNEMLDIPEGFRAWTSYQASSGHLINHGAEGNVEYVDCWHPRYPTTTSNTSLGPRFGRILCVKATTDMAPATELLVKYDLSVDGEGLKAAMKTMLNLGQMFSGKSREAFAREVKPYLKVR